MTALVMLAISVRATTYYVDYATGSDANVGTSTNAPWKHCPGDPMATGIPASTALEPGDIVVFKGGVSYLLAAPHLSIAQGGTGGIDLKWNGTQGHPITYDGNSSGSWGIGRAVFTDNYSDNQVHAFYKGPYDAISNLVFDNLEIGPIGGAASLPSTNGVSTSAGIPSNPGYGIYAYGSFKNITIENCYFHNLGYWFNKAPMGFQSISGNAIKGNNFDNVTITNCEFTKVSRGIEFGITGVATNLNVVNCSFHDYIVWSIDLAVASSNAAMDNIQIHGNTFRNFDKWYSHGYWSGYGGAPHQDGILERGESVTEAMGGGAMETFYCGTNINYYDNLFIDDFNSLGGSCAVNVSGGCSANLYNNLFINCVEPNGTVSYQSPPPTQNFLFQMFNNTFVSQNARCAIYLDGSVNVTNQYGDFDSSYFWPDLSKANVFLPPTNVVQVRIENNIFYSSASDAYNALILWSTTNVPVQQFVFDHNLYCTKNYLMLASGAGLTSDVRTLAGIQAQGWELHGMATDPLFVGTSYAVGTNTYLNDLHLQAGSPAIGAGTNLSSLDLPGLNSDFAGNPRPTTGNWTMGAYGFVPGLTTSAPSPPSFLHVLRFGL